MEHEFVSQHGSVAEEIAALVEALRAGGRREGMGEQSTGGSTGGTGSTRSRAPGAADEAAEGQDEEPAAAKTCTCDCDHTTIDACEICPVCRAIAALHTVSPGAVNALADLAHQAEITLRTLAADLRRQSEQAAAPREDIPVLDLDED